MGGFRSCSHVSGPDDSMSDGCFCPGCLFQKFKNKHAHVLTQGQIKEVPSPNQQQAAASNPALVLNNAPAHSGPHGEDVMSTAGSGGRGREGSGSQSQLQLRPQPAGETEFRVDTKSLQGVKVVLYPNPVGSEVQRIKSYAKALTSDAGRFGYMFPSSNYEDECPTCLEEYTPENPKIVAKCNHHYHLSCIYEWMERNENCPVCGKLMLFDEWSCNQRPG